MSDLQGRYVGVDDSPGYDLEVSNADPSKLKDCLICGKPFIKNRRAVYCNRQHYTTCVHCGKRIDITSEYFRAGFVPKTCCKSCADIVGASVLKENCLKKYGVANPMLVREFADKAFVNANPHLRLEDRRASEVRICEVCGKEFTAILTVPKKCCSAGCASKLREKHISEKTRICKLCGKPFSPKFGKSLYCDGPHYRACVICGESFLLKNPTSRTQVCSLECKDKLTRQTNLARYGVEIGSQSVDARVKLSDAFYKNHPDIPKSKKLSPNTKICKLCGESFIPTAKAQRVCENTHYRNCEVCGKEFVITMPSSSQLCCSAECTEKKRESTMRERYGVPYALQNSELLKKAQQTTFDHYGVKHSMQSPVVVQKVTQTCMDRYGVPTPFLIEGFADKSRETILQKYGTERIIPTTISKTNMRIAEDITQAVGLPCELDKVKLDRFSYDIHIVGTNILLEVDPTYTHNTVGNHWHHSGPSADYHQVKTNAATAQGYRCIHIFDWDDFDKVLQLLGDKQKVYARKCEIREVSSKATTIFEEDNHLQNSCRGQSARIGLYYNDELVQLMTFGKPRYNKHCSWELLRLCTRPDLIVIGGAERLFSCFVRTHSPDSIVSYCDLAKFTGDVYPRMGFVLDHITKPNKVWSKGKRAITNNLLLARGYDQLFGTSYGKGTSNEQLMLEHGWYPVYDCGQAVYIWRADPST